MTHPTAAKQATKPISPTAATAAPAAAAPALAAPAAAAVSWAH
eukprot:CAMPEP_0202896160 /NCGR_PEP_ID=MMETSP1392-20130828/5206_1 /ASSEMBLY_ACC=CAM_ASM_000868 /TAXON_ID=225041 /ORGANISM="Chlamydomonas chlamydogama, Strain SAG 11-48b" /LENGTH=42 /DNA_ID= /DNA_START= /DNA_END= /DNA_ORIENTATION=